MDIKVKNIKMIVLETDYCIYMEHVYSDVLKVTKNAISYKRKEFMLDKIVSSWQYKTNNELFYMNYESLIEAIDKELKEEKTIFYKTDSGGYSITIKFIDGANIRIDRTGNFYENDMIHLSDAFLKLIPNCEIYPDLLNNYSI